MAESFRSPRQILRRLRYLPLARKKIRNWPAFMYHYALGLKPAKPYHFGKTGFGYAVMEEDG